jgi:hypothetical protein
MASRLRKSLKPFRRRLGQALGIRQDEVTVISFPKSGRTWLQVMLGEYITRCYGLNVKNVMSLKHYTKALKGVPRIRFTHDERPQWKLPHELNSDKSAYRDQAVLLLVRDPRDILVSLYFEKTKRIPARRKDRQEFKGSINEFVYHEQGGIDSIITFFNNWARNRNIPSDLKIVKYEDLRRDTRGTLVDILSYLGLEPLDEQIVDTVLELGDIRKMRAREAESACGSHHIKRTDPEAGNAFATRDFQPPDPSDPDSYKVRRGKVGGYVDYLDSEAIQYLNKKISEKLDPLFAYS